MFQAYVRALKVFRLQKHVLWEVWVQTPRASNLRGWNVEEFIWRGSRCLHFESTWFDSLERSNVYLWGLSVVRLVWNRSRCFELKEVLVECFVCGRTHASVLNVIWVSLDKSTYLRWKICNFIYLIVLAYVWKQELLFVMNKIWLDWFYCPKTHLTSQEHFWIEWIGVETQSLKARIFIRDWKGVIRMHWIANIHLENEGCTWKWLVSVWRLLWGHWTCLEFEMILLGLFQCWNTHLRDKLAIRVQDEQTWVF